MVAEELALLAQGAVEFPADSVLLELTGSDRRSWLQGQVTQDLRGLAPWGMTRACLCSPTGQLQADLAIWDAEDRLLISTDPECAHAVLQRARDLVIMEDVSCRALALSLVSVQGPSAGEHLDGASLALSNDRSGYGGYDLWGSGLTTLNLSTISKDAAEIARIEAGIPRYGTDMGPRTLPPELGKKFESERISYSKGCYTGQEVLMRIHSRGHTNKTLVGLILDGPVEKGSTVEGGGEVTSACLSPRLGPIALATLRNELATKGTKVKVGARNGIVADLPF